MPQTPITPEQHKRILEVQSQYPELTRSQKAAKAGVSEGSFSKYHKMPVGGGASFSETNEEVNERSKETWRINLPRTSIQTLEQLVKQCAIDLDLWEVDRFVCKKWDMGAKEENYKGDKKTSRLVVKELFAVTAWLRKRVWVEEATAILEKLRKKAEKHAPIYPHIKPISSNSGNVVELSPVDVHFGALIWSKETGSADYDLKIAEKAYRDAISSLIQRTESYKPEKAILIVGHDQQNSDNRAGNTEAGTPQNNDGRYQKVFEVSCACTIWAIDACLLKYGSVEVYAIPGNHDPLATWHLGEILKAWYRNVPQVTIHNSPNPRKYWEYGVNMLLFTHGNKGKLENYDKTMAAEQPAMWGRTKWREAHTGDKHHRRLIETQGATVRILPSLRPPCAWSAENHYIGAIRAAEAYVWNKSEGLVGTACYSILEK